VATSVAPWSVADLTQRCRSLRAVLGEDGAATDQQLRDYWPGGKENQYTGKGAWIYCFAMYAAFNWSAAQRGGEASSAAVDTAIANRSTASPEPVRLTSGRTAAVYPKSYHALRYLDFLDAGHRKAGQLAAAAYDLGSAEALKVMQTYPLVESLAVRLWAWVLTTEGPGLPFKEDASNIELPEWLGELTAIDVVRLYQAHRKVNHDDIALISETFPGDPMKSRLPLSGFLNTYAHEAGHRPLDVFKQFSVGEIFADAVSSAQAAREARENADAKREER
jgi:hypothetical protein